ncbi:hypothetical protein [Halotia branconii]|uniref:Uncharacterized protein n=1 Tax=Halotia branconii CENA392 TaxID=1539056 RepID=A0AAJ6PCP0_9CYAN|nr:hypothetical protein [Halotia branconii]WGV28981.1 hypothetical protein QI031_22005 [Halotia branconii CENA392]
MPLKPMDLALEFSTVDDKTFSAFLTHLFVTVEAIAVDATLRAIA